MADKVRPPGFTQDVGTDTRSIAGDSVEVQRVDEQGGTAIASNQISIATTATQIAAARETRKRIALVNKGGRDVYIGAAGVTASTGRLLAFGDPPMEILTTAAVFGIVDIGSGSIHYVEVYDS
jgi:hypothetical protein